MDLPTIDLTCDRATLKPFTSPDVYADPISSDDILKRRNHRKLNELGPYRFIECRQKKGFEDRTLTAGALRRAAFDHSTAHGYPNTLHSRGLIKNLFWSISLLALSAVLMVGSSNLLTRYFRRDVSYDVIVTAQQQVVFPAVTICSLSPVKRSALESSAFNSVQTRRKRSTETNRTSIEPDSDNSTETVETTLKPVLDLFYCIYPTSATRLHTTPRASNFTIDSQKSTAASYQTFFSRTAPDTTSLPNDLATSNENTSSSSVSAFNSTKITNSSNSTIFRSCPVGWTQYESSCYNATYGTPIATQYGCCTFCKSMGAYMASIIDVKELCFVLGITAGVIEQSFWLGLYKTAATINSTTNWQDGHLYTFRNWAAGQPSTSAQCVVLQPNGTYADNDCFDATPQCICKQPAAKPPSTATVPKKSNSSQIFSNGSDITDATKLMASMSSPETILDDFVSTDNATTTITRAYTNAATSTETTFVASTSSEAPESSITSKITDFSTTDAIPLSTASDFNETGYNLSVSISQINQSESNLTAANKTTPKPPTGPFINCIYFPPPVPSVATTTPSITSTRSTTASVKVSTRKALTTPGRTTSRTQTTVQPITTTMRPQNKVQCCCRCCLTSDLSTCNQCSAQSLSGAASCAATVSPRITEWVNPFVPSPSPSFSSSPTVSGSSCPDRKVLTAMAQQQQQLTEQLASMSLEQKISLGFQKGDMLLDCTYDGEVCNVNTDFSQLYNPTLGNCYIFNSGWNGTSPVKNSTKPGKQHGLSLVLNVRQYDYASGAGTTAGLVVLVLPQYAMAFPEDHGMLISPGYSTSISLSAVTVSRLATPYGDCTDSDTDRNMFSLYYPVQYTRSACIKTCYVKYVISNCHCSDPYYPVPAEMNVPVCSSDDVTQGDCLFNVTSQWSKSTSDCDCPDRCNDVDVVMKSTHAMWPSTSSMNYVARMLKPTLEDSFNVNDPQMIRNNLARVDVFFGDFTTESVVQSPDYPLTQLLADFGGIAGLWLGFAVMSFVEMFEFFIDLCVFTVYRLYTRIKKKK